MRSGHFQTFVDPARARPQIWRTVLGLVVVVAATLAGVVAIFGVAYLITGRGEDGYDWANRMATPDTPLGTLLLLYSFLGMALGTVLAARWLHRRRAGTLFGRAPRVLRDFATAFAVVAVLMGLSVVGWSFSYDPVPNLAPGRWLMLLPLTLLALLIQTGAEELLFRGYLQQQLAARFAARAIWLLLPAALFGLVHYNPALPPESRWMIVGAAAAFGLAAADLTARTGSIGAAWGFHFANNALAVAVLATDGAITGLALFRTPYAVDQSASLDALVLIDLGFLVLAWWLVRRMVAR